MDKRKAIVGTISTQQNRRYCAKDGTLHPDPKSMAVTDGRLSCAVSGAAPPARIHLRIYLARLGSIAAAKERAAAVWRAARRGAASIEICGVAESRRCRPQRGKNYVLTRFAT